MTQSTFVFGGASWAQLSSTAFTHSQRGSNTIAQLSKFKFLGIDTLTGNITNTTEPELAALFAPFDTIIACTGMTYPPGTQLNLTRAILASPTRPYFPWQFGADYDIIGRGSSQDLLSEQLWATTPAAADGD